MYTTTLIGGACGGGITDVTGDGVQLGLGDQGAHVGHRSECLGASYYFSVTDHEFKFHVSGLESELESVLKLCQNMLSNFKFDEDKVKQVVNRIHIGNKHKIKSKWNENKSKMKIK